MAGRWALPRGLVAAWGIALGLSACSGREPAAPTFTATDSAGVRVVTSLAPAWGEDEGWSVATEPELSIGRLEGEAPYLFDRIVGATRLADGRIVVLNAGDGELRWYSPDGVFLKRSGGLGEGPGELDRPAGLIRLPGDTLMVTELAGWKSTVFDPDGLYVRGSRLDVARRAELVDSTWGCPVRPDAIADGSYVGCAGSGIPAPQLPGVERVSHWLYRTTHAVRRVDTVGVVHGFSPDLLLGAYGSPTASGGDPLEIWVGDPAHFTITRWTDGEGIELLIRHPDGLRPVEAEERARYEESFPGALERPGVEFAPNLPAFTHLTRDATGHLWVTKYDAPWEHAGGAWIFAAEGYLLGEVALPADFEPLEIGVDYVLGVSTDAVGVERVLVLGLERGRGRRP